MHIHRVFEVDLYKAMKVLVSANYLTTYTNLSPIRRGFALGFVNYKLGALDSQPQVIVYQLLAYDRWFSPGTPAFSTSKTGRHDIAEILLKVALKHKKSINQME